MYPIVRYVSPESRDIRGSRIGPPYARLEERLEKALVDARADQLRLRGGVAAEVAEDGDLGGGDRVDHRLERLPK